MAIANASDGSRQKPRISVVPAPDQEAGAQDAARPGAEERKPTGRPGQGFYAATGKRGIDIIFASVALLVLLPLLLLVALAIRLDSPGPALFRQRRVGRDGHFFTIYKFRTMRDNPGKHIEWVMDDAGKKRHKVRNDPRITRVGRWLRRMSIDELPQLINILIGHMSVIGPRPELLEIVAHYEPWQHRRHDVRPGLTGWWQVSGRSDRPMHEHTELDLYYVDNISVWMDLKILVRTVGVVVRGLGAF